MASNSKNASQSNITPVDQQPSRELMTQAQMDFQAVSEKIDEQFRTLYPQNDELLFNEFTDTIYAMPIHQEDESVHGPSGNPKAKNDEFTDGLFKTLGYKKDPVLDKMNNALDAENRELFLESVPKYCEVPELKHGDEVKLSAEDLRWLRVFEAIDARNMDEFHKLFDELLGPEKEEDKLAAREHAAMPDHQFFAELTKMVSSLDPKKLGGNDSWFPVE